MTMTSERDLMRGEFEAWCQKNGYDTRPSLGNGFGVYTVQIMWVAWQAARRAQHSTAEPVAHRQGCETLGGYGHGVGACSCGAVAAPQQAPLTDEQIDRIWSNSTPSNFEARSFARAIERAHGISAAKERNEAAPYAVPHLR